VYEYSVLFKKRLLRPVGYYRALFPLGVRRGTTGTHYGLVAVSDVSVGDWHANKLLTSLCPYFYIL